jgi:glycosyltransferase involved in cell wall biosynthesis
MISIVIPAFNEEKGIKEVLEALRSHHTDKEIIVVDDGSTDNTAEKVEQLINPHPSPLPSKGEGRNQIKLVCHPYNKGYGAALKTGIESAKGDWCMTYDADGQHTPDLIDTLTKEIDDSTHLVIGKREGYQGPLIRQPGKWLIRQVANYLVERRIPDLNSGLRAFKKDTFLRYAHLFPNGFSLSTTSTVCFYKENLNVKFVPITIQKRTGKSTVHPNDAIKTFMLIVRLIMLFSPLRIFLPVSALLGLFTLGTVGYQLIKDNNISDSAVILISLTAMLFFFGLLADQIAALRREQGKRLAVSG